MSEESTEVVLVRIDGRLSVVEDGLRELRGDVRGGFAGLKFVDQTLYSEHRKGARDYAEETRKIAETARTVAMATLSFVVVAVGMMLALIKAIGS